MSQKAIFLDRDDTLIDDPGYIKSPEQVKLLPGAAEALTQFKKLGYLLVIVTNQSAIARGYIDERQLDEIHTHMRNLLAGEGVNIDGLYYCPFHPEGVVKDYSMESNLRKPNSGMLEKAADELNVDLCRSWMIGDSYRDVKAGKKAGCHTILVDVPGKTREMQEDDPTPDRKAVNLREAVNIVRMHEFHQKAKTAKKNKTESGSAEANTKPAPTSRIEVTETVTAEASKAPASVSMTPPPEVKETPPAVSSAPATKKRSASSQPVKLHTTKPVTSQEEPAGIDNPSEKTHHLLEEVLQRLKSHSRTDLYDDFSVFKLFAVMTQVVALTCLATSVAFLLNRTPDYNKIQIMASYGIMLQLVVIALLLMHKRD